MAKLVEEDPGLGKNYVNADDIRTKLLDSILLRLRERTDDVQNKSWDISEWRKYAQWLLVATLLIVFCILRYGVETVYLQPSEERVGDPVIEYKNRQLEKTSEEFRERHHYQ